MEQEEVKTKRRKGRPLNKPIISKERAVFNHIMLIGTLVILVFGVYIFVTRSKEIIRFSYEETLQTAKIASFSLSSSENDTVEKEAALAARNVSSAAKSVWEGEERKAAEEYTADESVVYFSHFDDITESTEYKDVLKVLKETSELSDMVNSLSLVFIDEEKNLMVYVVSELEKCGYAQKLEGFGDEGVSHAAYVPVYKGTGENKELVCYIYANFDSGDFFSDTFKSLWTPVLVSFLITLLGAGYYYFKMKADKSEAEVNKNIP
ncbi:MAG: hypothetical protein K6F97_00640 [Lachnospiraceae bacterium]|nr:hypothetical protein [Lachnospiraceae bacterium]